MGPFPLPVAAAAVVAPPPPAEVVPPPAAAVVAVVRAPLVLPLKKRQPLVLPLKKRQPPPADVLPEYKDCSVGFSAALERFRAVHIAARPAINASSPKFLATVARACDELWLSILRRRATIRSEEDMLDIERRRV